MRADLKTDTSPAAAEIQAGILRRLSPGRRLELAVEMSLMTRELLGARLRAAHPDWSESEVARELLRILRAGAVLPPRLKARG